MTGESRALTGSARLLAPPPPGCEKQNRHARAGGPLARFLLAGVVLYVTACMIFVGVPVRSASGPSDASVGTFATAPFPTPASFPISHIVFLMMENHAYDNYFGTYCVKISKLCSFVAKGLPSGLCVPTLPGNASSPCIRPFALNASFVTRSSGGTHNWVASHAAYDGGLMDGFYRASPFNTNIMGYYNGSTIPEYWNLAEQFGLGDNFFSSVLDYSPPNHWLPLAGQTPPEALLEYAPSIIGGHAAPLTPAEETYLNQSNVTSTLNDKIAVSPYSWKFYDDSFRNKTYSEALNLTVAGSATQPSVFDYWNPLAGRASSYTPTMEPNVVNRSTFVTDAAAGRLPNVSWVIPAINQSDHPINNIGTGMSFVASIVNAIQTSPQWKSTAIFVTWDEYGGYYDHVAPPQIDGIGLGFRVPLLVISPYTPVGYVSHQLGDFVSVLRLMEWRFGLGNFTARDAAALPPMDYFDLNATPRAPSVVPTTAHYPMKLPNQKALPVSGLSVSVSGSVATVKWGESAGGSPIAGYTIKWGLLHGTLNGPTVGRNITEVQLPGLSCNATYLFQVRSFAGQNTSAPAVVRVTTGACGAAPVRGAPFSVLTTTIATSGTDDRSIRPPTHPHGADGRTSGLTFRVGRSRCVSTPPHRAARSRA